MRRFTVGLSSLSLLCLTGWLTGCASPQQPAPIRDTSQISRPLPPAPTGFHRIQRGDTLYNIAFQYGVDFRDLATWNQLADPGLILLGALLRVVPPAPPPKLIPKPEPVPPRATVSTAALPVTAEVSVRALPRTAMANVDVVPSMQTEAWVWPSRGPLLARFGEQANKGIDIGGSRGHPVRAANAGTVVYAGANLRGYGKLIIIRHGKTHLSAYAHNERMLVAEGQNVLRGQSIAEMGDTDADSVKLHFEIREYGKPVDPLDYLPKQS